MSAPLTVEAYLAAQPPERAAALAAVRDVVCRHLPPGYEEGIQYGISADSAAPAGGSPRRHPLGR